MDIELLLHTVSAERVLPSAENGEKLQGTEISAVTSDSRQVRQGTLFAALPGSRVDGCAFIADAARLGAAAVLCPKERVPQIIEESGSVLEGSGTLLFAVENVLSAYAETAANFYDRPAEGMQMLGVTGTNGKTTVSYLVRQILAHSGRQVGVIGTIHNSYTDREGRVVTLPTELTTPEPSVLQKVLREMADAGVQTVIMEASSHALVQHRVGGITFAGAALTNISRDHLDYHRTMEEYREAKSLLFSRYLAEDGTAVLPDTLADGGADSILSACRSAVSGQNGKRRNILYWGESGRADLQLKGCTLSLGKSDFSCSICGKCHTFTTPLVGRYNLENLLTAWGLCKAAGLDDSEIAAAVPYAVGAPGRLERVSVEKFWSGRAAEEEEDEGTAPVVLVDYAHTPDALEKVLECASALPHRTLCVVFGCGGDRDGGKRPLMGAVAARLADLVVVTDDNPRTEEPSEIIAEILPGIKDAEMPLFEKGWLAERTEKERGCVVIGNRAEAISTAIRSLGKGDLVVIAGKGHEPYQITAEGKRFFDDRREAEDALFSWTAALIARAAGGRVVEMERADKLLGSVVQTDSRAENRGGIFVALHGEKHDGHDFISEAEENGCRCVVVEREVSLQNKDTVQVIVGDTTKALGDMAAFRRRQLGAFLQQGKAQSGAQNGEKRSKQWIIGITGSCGKTTVKEMIAAILRRHWQPGEHYPANVVLKTASNFNNAIGLPLSLLPLGVQHRAAVLEMGMNASGEIARLAEIAQPEMSCITNVFAAHLQGLGSIEGVAEAKGELFAGTSEDGILVVNLDDKHIVELAKTRGKRGQRRIGFSLYKGEAELWADAISLNQGGRYRFTLHRKGGRQESGGCAETVEIALGAAGEHNINNALAAAAVCSEVGCSLPDIAAGLADFLSADKRLEMLESAAGYTVINDCYNASPASMAAGLRTLASLGAERTVAIVGDMLELGDEAEAAHREVGRLAAKLGISSLAAVGDFAQSIADAACQNGMKKRAVRSFADKPSLMRWLKKERGGFGAGDAILVKASRKLALESVVRELL